MAIGGKIIIETDIATKESERKLEELKKDVEQAGESISESFSIDTEKLENQFRKAKISLEQIADKASETKFALDELGSLNNEIANFEREKAELKSWEQENKLAFNNGKISLQEYQESLKLIADGYNGLDTSIEKVKAEMATIGDTNKLSAQLDTQQAQLERATISYENLGLSAEKMSNNVEKAVIKSNELANETNKTDANIKDSVKQTNKLDSAMDKTEKTTQKVAKSSASIGSGVDKAIKKVIRYGFALFSIRSIYQALRNLSNRWLQSEEASARQIRANIDAMANALANGLAPVLEFITGLMVTLFGYFNAILKTFFGIDLMSKKLGKNTDKIGSGAKNVTKELKKWTGSFDKADIASGNIADNLGGAGGGGGMDLPEAIIPEPDISGIVRLFDKIKESFLNIWNNADFQTALGNIKRIFTNVMNSLISVASNVIDNILMVWDLMFPHLERGFTSMFTYWQAVLSDIADFTDTWLHMLTEKFNILVDNIYSTMAPLYEFMAQLWADLWEIILELWETNGADILNRIGTTVDTVLTVWGRLWELVDAILGPIVEALKIAWDTTLKDMLLNVGNFMIEMWGHATDFYNKFVGPIVGFMVDYMKPILTMVWNTIGGVIAGTLNLIGSNVSSSIANVRGILSGLIDFISGVFTNNWSRAWNGVVTIFGTIFNGIKNMVKSPINFIIDSINGFLRGLNKIKIPSWVPAVGGKGFNIPTIPRLAKGGVLRSETLNIAGEYAGARTNPEIVTPQKLLDERIALGLKNANLSGNGEQVINLVLENDKIARAVVNTNENKDFQMNGGAVYGFI